MFIAKARLSSRGVHYIHLLLVVTLTSLGAVRLEAAAKSQKKSVIPAAISLQGWEFSFKKDEKRPPEGIGNDPVLGRLVCPPLTRVDLAESSSDPLLIKNVGVEKSGANPVWRYELRTGIHWWSGEVVTSVDLAAFLSREMQAAVDAWGEKRWSVPAHKVEADGSGTVSIKWQSTPEFGPYFLNGFAFFREKSGGFECAGWYEPRFEGETTTLVPTKGYPTKRPTITLKSAVDSAGKLPKDTIAFKKAIDFGGSPWVRLSDTPASCTIKLEIPVFTVIAWNTRSGGAADAELRKVFTMLMPRGALLRAGAGFLGELVSGPVPRAHPGYDETLKVRDFDLKQASAALDRLGYSRPDAMAPRMTPAGKPMALTVHAMTESESLVEKVTRDAFAAVGIKLTFTRGSEPSPTADGVLTALKSDWPHVDWGSRMRSAADASFPFWNVQDKELEQDLSHYAKSLTTEKPAFSEMRAIHKRLFDLEPMSVLMQHMVCLETFQADAKSKKVDVRDPDWFRDLIL